MKKVQGFHLRIVVENDERDALEIVNAMMAACKEIAGPTLREWQQEWNTTAVSDSSQ